MPPFLSSLLQQSSTLVLILQILQRRQIHRQHRLSRNQNHSQQHFKQHKQKIGRKKKVSQNSIPQNLFPRHSSQSTGRGQGLPPAPADSTFMSAYSSTRQKCITHLQESNTRPAFPPVMLSSTHTPVRAGDTRLRSLRPGPREFDLDGPKWP